MNVKPLGTRVLIKPQEAEQKTASGLIIPNSAQEKPKQGSVVAVGSSDEIEVKVGDNVIFGKFAGTEIIIEGTEYLIMEQADVLAVV